MGRAGPRACTLVRIDPPDSFGFNYDLSTRVTRENPRHLTGLARRVLGSVGEGTGISDEEATVNLMNSAKLRRLIPAGAVATVLALSYLAPLPSEASNGHGGFGYNCGVKGYGYHDHGKPCPNRPFPGKGEGLEKFGVGATTSGDEGTGTTTSSQNTEIATQSQGNAGTPAGKSHGHGQGNSQGKGH